MNEVPTYKSTYNKSKTVHIVDSNLDVREELGVLFRIDGFNVEFSTTIPKFQILSDYADRTSHLSTSTLLMKLGADGVIPKPLDKERVLQDEHRVIAEMLDGADMILNR